MGIKIVNSQMKGIGLGINSQTPEWEWELKLLIAK